MTFKEMFSGCDFKMAVSDDYPEGTVKKPTRGTPGSAGLDFYCPLKSGPFREKFMEMNRTNSYVWGSESITVPAGAKIVIPSGIKTRLPEWTALIHFEKSGLATKSGILPTARVDDSDYAGELFLGIHNVSKKDYEVKFGEKVAQYLLMPVIMQDPEFVSDESLWANYKTERGEGAMGSTGMN